jgi:hypothetical protein
MAKVRFDGLRDFVISRRPVGGFSEKLEYKSYVNLTTMTLVGMPQTATISCTDQHCEVVAYGEKRHDFDYYYGAGDSECGVDASGTLYAGTGITYYDRLYVGQAWVRATQAGAQVYIDSQIPHTKIVAITFNSDIPSGEITVTPGNSFVPGYRMFGYDYVHPHEAHWGTGDTTETVSGAWGSMDMDCDVGEQRIFVQTSKKSLGLWNFLKGSDLKYSSSGTKENGVMSLRNRKSNKTDFLALNGSLYDKIVSGCSSWVEMGPKDVLNSSSNFKIYGIAYLQKHSNIDCTISLNTSAANATVSADASSHTPALSVGNHNSFAAMCGLTGTLLAEHVRPTV